MLKKLHEKPFPKVNLMDVYCTGKQEFRGEVAYNHIDILHPPPSDSRFLHCNILGLDWLDRTQAHLDLKIRKLIIQH